ncbi:transketolase [Halobacteriovorax sp. HLS]|uniref:transketolase n=1 Tax=Halobacteriovorax sp. HLS TaxID=2234000 RepID=UPI000FDA3E9F|nr:transketolase [Halobacteriovorax sp. HLS]
MDYEYLKEKSKFVRVETLKIHQRVAETRVASSLSPIEIVVSLYYGGIIKFDPKDRFSDSRDRFIISKGHGSICMYPLLADLGFFDVSELENACKKGSFLGGIPDPVIPGYETVNGSLGHGPGVASGMAVALKSLNKKENVVVLTGDGELNEGSVWEAVMFASHHKLDNLTIIVDNNKTSMLNRSEQIVNLSPLSSRFEAFGWDTFEVQDGHSVQEVHSVLDKRIPERSGKPKVIIVNTVKGKGVPFLEKHHLCHILSVGSESIDEIIKDLE